MSNIVFDFLERHPSFVLTTHDSADADGLGAEKVFSLIVRSMGKKVRVINSGPVPEHFQFMDSEKTIGVYEGPDSFPKNAALVMLDTADEYHIGKAREFIPLASEVFVIDHHEPKSFNTFKGLIDNSASSVSEITVELAQAAGVKLTPECALAAYAGIVYDTGFFAYSKTTSRTFRAALSLTEAGVNPNKVYRELNESASNSALLLQQTVFSGLEIHNRGRVAVQILRKEDLEKCGASFEDAENFINIPMKSRDIEVSVLVKENQEGQIRCSLRSKGNVNVSKIAQVLGGGGHVSAAGFKSALDPGETLSLALEKITAALEEL